ncbi:restriction endonuclease subunit S [Candidatus Enterococcus clewellii]|uniref:restriction endonuclease subunit S n=1 Tax=Candidatus Enterococcus clewellii TaxID=1834193 RepID=UPI0030CAC3AE
MIQTWEQRELGEVVNFLNGKAYKQQELLDSGKYRVLRVGNFNTNDRWYYSDLELEENKYANNGDLLYLWATNFGPEIWNEERVIYHYHIWKLQLLSNELDKQYLYTWLLTDKERIKQATNGTTMVHVTKGNMEQREFQYPTDIVEQQKLGSFFKQLDNTIALHLGKVDALKQIKKGFLQQLFPRNGKNVPGVRFADFEEEWEQRKLGEDINFLNGRAYKQNELLDEGKYRVLRVGNFNTNDSWYYSNLELDGSKYANKGDLLYLWATNFGPEIWKQEKVIYHYHIWKLELINDNVDQQYLYTWLETDKERIKQNTNGTTMVHVTKGNMEQREFQLPLNIIEQQKISAFFNQLDDIITLYQYKLEQLKILKKSYLQNMFI